jgi:pyrophosphate--fructose-6-phosphate 1-phosphotransferase
VILVPASVDHALPLPASLGHHTTTALYAALIGNVASDAASAKKYYHFIRLMGRTSSRVALECALRTRPNVTVVAEEGRRLEEVAAAIADIVEERAGIIAGGGGAPMETDGGGGGVHHGIVLVPEGVLTHFPAINALTAAIRAASSGTGPLEDRLPEWLAALYLSLPVGIRSQLSMADSDGSVRLSHVETERLLIHAVELELRRRSAARNGGLARDETKFSALPTFFGYQGRCALPSLFDCSLGVAAGRAAVALCAAGHSGLGAGGGGLRFFCALCGIVCVCVFSVRYKKLKIND